MILKSIKLHNYRLYQDIIIDFSNDNSNISIIKGNSGVGKTTLLNAISWCLYGDELFLRESSLGICNVEATNSIEIGEDINVSVELIFDDGGETLVFHRIHGFHKGKTGLSVSENKLKVLIKKGNVILVEDDHALEFIEKKIPKKLLHYFLIGGEYLEGSLYDNSFRQSIELYYNLSQLDIIESSIRHLERFKHDFMSRQMKIDSKLEKINEKINGIKNGIIDADEKKKTNQLEQKKILEKIDDTKKKLDNYPNVQTKFDRRIGLEGLIEKNNLELINLKEELKMYILTKYPYIFAYESLNKFTDACKNSKETINHMNLTKAVIKNITEFKTVSNDLHHKISQIENGQDKFNDEKHEIDEFLLSIEDDEIKRLVHQYPQLNSLKHSKDIKIQEYSDTINKLNEELKEELKSHENLIEELKRTQNQITFCEESIEVARDILTDLKENMLKRFESLTNMLFHEVYWKESRAVVINNEGVFFKDIDGNLIHPSHFSAVENYALSLSCIFAVQKIYGLNIPIILDTPFYRLDNDSRKSVLKFLIQFSKEKQIILLLNNVEYTDEYQDILNKENVKIYEISCKDQQSWVILNE